MTIKVAAIVTWWCPSILSLSLLQLRFFSRNADFETTLPTADYEVSSTVRRQSLFSNRCSPSLVQLKKNILAPSYFLRDC